MLVAREQSDADHEQTMASSEEDSEQHRLRRELPGGRPYPCPCCGCRTVDERGGSEVCHVCGWEDEGQNDEDAAVVRGGPNGALSLNQARANFRRLGACDEGMLDYVRPPLPEERPRL